MPAKRDFYGLIEMMALRIIGLSKGNRTGAPPMAGVAWSSASAEGMHRAKRHWNFPCRRLGARPCSLSCIVIKLTGRLSRTGSERPCQQDGSRRAGESRSFLKCQRQLLIVIGRRKRGLQDPFSVLATGTD